MRGCRFVALALVAGLTLMPVAVSAAPEGQLTWAVHVSLAPTWFDPAETSGIITPYMILYAIHDALVKPMPGNPMAPSLAESWNGSLDGRSYDFKLRKGATFHKPVAGFPALLHERERRWLDRSEEVRGEGR